jgi:CRP-like cAMP-binding protein
VGFHYPGDVFGLDETIRQESAQAVTDVRCLSVVPPTHTRIDSLDANRTQAVMKKALASANRCIRLFGRRTAPERIAAFILMLAECQGAHDRIELPMCRSDIADYLGLTIHTVSRTISQLCQDGLIKQEGPHHCRILDRHLLGNLAGESGTARVAGKESIPEEGAYSAMA